MIFQNFRSLLKPQEKHVLLLKHSTEKSSYLFFFLFVVLTALWISPDFCYAVSTEALRETMRDAKSETFSWMFLVKVAAAAIGSAVAVFKQSPAPFGLGIGTTIAIHMWDKYLGDGMSALI
jgi:hypothetical protein